MSKKTQKVMDSKDEVEDQEDEKKKFVFNELSEDQKELLVKNICDIVFL